MNDMDRRCLEEMSCQMDLADLLEEEELAVGGPGRLPGGGETRALKDEQDLANAEHALA